MTPEEKLIEKIERFCLKHTSKEKLFDNLLSQMKKHIVEVKELKRKKSKHLDDEVTDMYLIALGLLYLRKINEKTKKKRAKHCWNKKIKIYKK